VDHYLLISDNFQNTIETIALSVDALASPISEGSNLLVSTLLRDGKIISCGNGADGALAQLFACNLLNRFEHDRPALPALALTSDGASLLGIAQGGGLNETFSRQVRALGQPGDTLLCISSGGDATNLLRAIQAAHERDMTVVALLHGGDAELGSLLQHDDVQITVDHPRRARVVEMHTMVLHCLCQLIDHSLFGAYSQD
jgi:phosphoheptose isomerase